MSRNNPAQFNALLLEHSRTLKNALHTIIKDITNTDITIYHVFEYAWDGWHQYIAQHANSSARVLLLGINPGPHGMVQTGVPFGNISHVQHWLKLSPEIALPQHVHHKRPVRGMEYARDEPSGKLLWSSIQAHFHTPESFFSQYFVINFCPLAFFDKEGKNLTPDKLPLPMRKAIEHACIAHLFAYLQLFSATHIIGIGRYAYNHAVKMISSQQAHAPADIAVHYLTHPSPLNPHHARFAAEFMRLHTLIY